MRRFDTETVEPSRAVSTLRPFTTGSWRPDYALGLTKHRPSGRPKARARARMGTPRGSVPPVGALHAAHFHAPDPGPGRPRRLRRRRFQYLQHGAGAGYLRGRPRDTQPRNCADQSRRARLHLRCLPGAPGSGFPGDLSGRARGAESGSRGESRFLPGRYRNGVHQRDDRRFAARRRQDPVVVRLQRASDARSRRIRARTRRDGGGGTGLPRRHRGRPRRRYRPRLRTLPTRTRPWSSCASPA